MDNNALADELEGLITASTKGDLATAELHTASEMVECPLCGDGEIEAANYCNFDSVALGVQFYGIGNEFGAHEKLWRWFTEHRDTILAALRTPAPAPVSGDVVAWNGAKVIGSDIREAIAAEINVGNRYETADRIITALQAHPAQAQGDDVVERVARALAQAKGIEICSDARYAQSSFRGPALAALAAMQQQECHAVLRYDRTTPGNENEMPKVLSCNWLPDGEYQVFLGPQQTPVAEDVRELVEALQATASEEGLTYFERSAEEIGLMVMDNHKAVLSRLTQPQPDAAVAVEQLQHVAYFDEGQFHWMSGIAPRDCELYARPIRAGGQP